ncbi:MAG: radical SAM protein [Candidatus Altiarchaeota archaeon]
MTLKVALIQASGTPKEEFGPVSRFATMTPPLGLLYLASQARLDGHVIEIHDASLSKIKIKHQVDVVGISASTPTFYHAIEIAAQLKNEFDVPILIGGPHISAFPSDLNPSSFDYAILGESEITIRNLLKAIENGSGIKDVQGIAFKDDKGEIITTKKQPLIPNLDDLPIPAYDLIDLNEYKASPVISKRIPLGSMITSRGCPYKCVYCDRRIFGEKFRAHSPKRVVEEIALLKEKHGAKEIRFWDDSFNIEKQRVMAICESLINEGLDIEWSCLARANLVDKEMLAMMRKAGCWQISYGLESGTQKLLDSIKKGLTLKQGEDAVKWTKAEGIESRGFFMLGLPGETKDTLNDTVSFACKIHLDLAQFYTTIPFPGSELYQISQVSGELNVSDWKFFRPNFPKRQPFIPKGLSEEEILNHQRKAYRRFYLRPSYILKQVFRMMKPENWIRIKRIIKANHSQHQTNQ